MGKDLGAQARKAVTLEPKPGLVLVQIGENDFACDGHQGRHYDHFRVELNAALDILAKGLPNARIFMVSAWGSEDSYVKILKGLSTYRRLMQAGNSPCQEVSSSGQIVPARVAYVKKGLAGYEAQKVASCARLTQCRYDRGAASRIGLTNGDVTYDLQHPTIQGHAGLAAVEWAAMSGFVH